MEHAAASSATARDIIREILRNMREGLEPLHYSTLPPAVYHVYLHPQDMERLRAIIPRIVIEARRALDAELEALNKASVAERLKITRREGPKVSPPEGGWQIRILENTDDDVEAGDIVIHSELAMPPKDELGSGAMTKRIATRRLAGLETASQSYEPSAAKEPAPQPDLPSVQPEPSPSGPGVHAVIEYEDSTGRKTFRMAKDQIVAGRGGRDYWTDLKFDTVPDVSREHFRLRRDPESGKFYIIDVSTLGTTIDGKQIPKEQEIEVPPKARIGLAGVLFLDFQAQ